MVGQRKRRRSPEYPEAVIRTARELYLRPMAVGAVMRELTKRIESGALASETIPHENTVKTWVRDLRRDESAVWSLASPDGGPEPEPDLVLPVLGYLIDQGSPIASLSTWEAKVITRVRIARSDLSEEQVWHVTRSLIAAEQNGDGEARDELHAFLAAKPATFRAGIEAGRYTGTAAGTAVPYVWEGKP